VKALFRKYRNMADSFRDHGHFLRDNPRYASAFQHTHDPNEFARQIQHDGYATDPQYASKLIHLMQTYNLYQYDRQGNSSPPSHREETP
ncbi:MAG: glucosaminidase domain-containing protein, partial [Ktedonobacteraceae bacterium]|nr:glucosaminidase domain-containing protein [Ktedonobacteraceae bacterium]